VRKVLLPGLAKDEHVIQVDENGKGAKKRIHEAWEGSGSIFKTVRYLEEFIKAKWRNNCRFRNVVFGHGNLIISILQVKFCKNCGTL
jgi:hypothetical protein